MRHSMLAAAIAAVLSTASAAQQAPPTEDDSIPLTYVGTNLSAGISVNDDGDFGGEVRAFWGVNPRTLWFGEAWGQDYGAAGIKMGYHWLWNGGTREAETEKPGSVTVAKVFVAADRNRYKDEKVSLGFGLERERWFGSVAVSSAISDERLVNSDIEIDTNVLTGSEGGRPYQQTQTIETLIESFEHPYDTGIGARFGRFFDAQSVRLQGGVDFERGDFDSKQFTASIGAQKYFSGTGHSLALDVEAIDKDGLFEIDNSDTRGWLTWRYEFGGDSFRPTKRIDNVEHRREVVSNVPADPVVIRNEIRFNADAFFNFDRSDLTDAGISELQAIADAINSERRISRVSVVGHTCDIGAEAYNQSLSERRAASVRDWFSAHAVDVAELDVSGKGESEPKYPSTKEERQKNRRVDVSFLTVEEKTESPAATPKTETIVEWTRTEVPLPNTWIDRAMRNPAAHKRTVDVYRYEETTVTETLGARVYLNREPLAVNDTVTLQRGTSTTVSVLTNDLDPDGNPLTVTAVTQPAHGSVSFTAAGVTYTPATGYVGSDGFTYTISDGQGGTDTASVAVTVFDRAPVANVDTATTPEGTPVTINALANDSDPDGDTIVISAVGTPAHGSASISAGAVLYTPSAGYVGNDSFSYTITDAHGTSASSTINVSVTQAVPSNLPPIAVDDAAETVNLVWVLVDVLANDSDPDGDSFSVVASTAPANGVAVQVAPGKFHYKANVAFCGIDSFTYTIRDSAGNEATATVTVNVLD